MSLHFLLPPVSLVEEHAVLNGRKAKLTFARCSICRRAWQMSTKAQNVVAQSQAFLPTPRKYFFCHSVFFSDFCIGKEVA